MNSVLKIKLYSEALWGFPGGTSGKEPVCQCRRHKSHGFDPWVGKITWKRAWPPTLATENAMDIGAWRGTVHRVTKSQEQLKQLSVRLAKQMEGKRERSGWKEPSAARGWLKVRMWTGSDTVLKDGFQACAEQRADQKMNCDLLMKMPHYFAITPIQSPKLSCEMKARDPMARKEGTLCEWRRAHTSRTRGSLRSAPIWTKTSEAPYCRVPTWRADRE